MPEYLNRDSKTTGGCSILPESLHQKQQHGNHDDGSHAAVFFVCFFSINARVVKKGVAGLKEMGYYVVCKPCVFLG